MLHAVRAAARGAVVEGRMSSDAGESLIDSFQQQMHAYTYLKL